MICLGLAWLGLDIVRVHKMQTWPPNEAHIQTLDVEWVIEDNTYQSLDVKSFHTNTSEWD